MPLYRANDSCVGWPRTSWLPETQCIGMSSDSPAVTRISSACSSKGSSWSLVMSPHVTTKAGRSRLTASITLP